MIPPAVGDTAARFALAPAERLVLWGIRTWFVGARADAYMLTTIAAAFRQAMAGPAVPVLDTAMMLTSAAAGRALSVHCPCCPDFSDDERLLLDLLALHQAGEPATALFLSRVLLPPAGARLAGPALRAFAIALAECGLRIPDRRGQTAPTCWTPSREQRTLNVRLH